MSGVPQLRFPGFEGDWKSSTLGEETTSLDGKRAPIKADHRSQMPGEYPYYGASGVIDHIDRYVFDETLLLLAEDGANIVNRATPVAFLASGKFWVNNHAHVYRPKGDPVFLVNALERIDFVPFNSGTTMPKLNAQTCSTIPLLLPTLPEQTKIAAFLGVVDANLTASRRKKGGLESFKSGLMQQLFAQTLRFTRDDGADFPDWEEKTLGELVDWQSTNSLSREFLTEEPGKFQNIHYGDIHGKFPALFRQSEVNAPYISAGAPLREPTKAQFCRAGDVIFADASEDYADIGKSIEIIEVEEGSLLSGLHTHLARPKRGSLAIGFSGYMMRTDAVRRQIMRFAQGISVLGISKDNLSRVHVQLPHPDEQRKIADAFSSIDAKITSMANQITHMETFKKGLIQQMFV